MGKGSNTSTNTSSTSASPQAAAAYSNVLNQAANVASTPYQAYTGELTAGVNSQQQAGISGINAAAGQAQYGLSAAQQQANAATSPITAQQIQSYQNPYTQQVVNATEAQLKDQDQQQQAGVTGNAISQGALGGNRVGVAQGVLGGQQAIANNSTIAGLYNTSYNQALSAAQAQQQTGLAGANATANYALQGQNAALSGANAQIGAGTLQQQTQQAQDTANYGQYAQAQAYPYQQTQWLAGIDSAIAPGLGSTSTGSTTGPAPNQTAQYLGAGLAGASLLLSDRDAKTNIHKIGSLNDGTPIYRYQYKGSDEWHVGPMAQDVERRHPHAVHQGGVGGFKYVDLKAATEASVHKAHGGPVAGLAVGGTPWSFAQGWIPTFSGSGSTAPHAGSSPGLQNTQSPSIDYSKLGNFTANPNGVFASNPAYGGDNMLTGAYGGSSSSPLDGLDKSDYGVGFRRGGGVAGYDTGGTPTFDDRFDAAYPNLAPSPGVAGPAWNPDEPYRMPDQGAVDQWRAGNPVPPLGTPPIAQSDDSDSLPPEITGGSSGPAPGVGGGDSAMAFAQPPAPYTTNPAGAYYAPVSQPSDAASQPNKGLGIGFGLISPNAQSGLLAAGLGMLSSRSPFLGNAIGEGGVAGLSAYNASEQQDRQVAAEAQKLATAAKQHAEEMKLRQDTQSETARHNKATEEKEYKPTLVNQVDPNTGETQHFLFDPNAKKLTPLATPVNDTAGTSSGKFVSTAAPAEERRKAPAASPEARDESFYKYMQDNRPPGYADIVRGVADYEIDPNREASLQKGARDRLYRDVKQYDPTYDQTHFGEKTGVIQNFSRGPASQAVNSLNVSVAHLATLAELGDALQNGNVPAINKLGNAIAVQLGRPAPTNFDAAKEIVGDEVVKAVIGGVNSQADREAIKHLITSQQTPAQLKGVIQTFTALLGGQLDGQRQRYQAGTGLNNFDQKYLAPATQEALKRGLPGSQIDPAITRMVYPSGIPQQGGAAPATQPAAPQTKVINGVTYVNRNGQWFAQ